MEMSKSEISMEMLPTGTKIDWVIRNLEIEIRNRNPESHVSGDRLKCQTRPNLAHQCARVCQVFVFLYSHLFVLYHVLILQ